MPKCVEAVCSQQARSIIAKGCVACNSNEDVWLENARLQTEWDGCSIKCVRLVSPVAVLWPARRRLPSTAAAAQPLAHLVLVCV